MAILRPPNSASLFTFRAAEWAVQINIGTYGSPVWTWLRGLSKFEPSSEPTMQDDSDIDSDGWKSELVTAQKLNISVEGLRKGERPGSTVVPDPGVEFLRNKGLDKGYDNIVDVRYWRTDDIDQAYRHNFAVKFTDVGGSNEDLQKFTGTLSGRGKPTEISKPQGVDTNEVQLATILGEPTSGAIVWELLGDETTGVAFDATSGAFQTALESLVAIGAGNVAVVGANGGPYTITYQGDLAAVNMPPLTVKSHTLAGGTDEAVEILTVVEGYDAP